MQANRASNPLPLVPEATSARPIDMSPGGLHHMAVSHDDTTTGALHFFQDENGEVLSLI